MKWEKSVKLYSNNLCSDCNLQTPWLCSEQEDGACGPLPLRQKRAVAKWHLGCASSVQHAAVCFKPYAT
eukprot:6466571-Amphidinium_carterae.1